MADIKVNVGDKVVVYRNMPHLKHYHSKVPKGFSGTVAAVGGSSRYPYGMWAIVCCGFKTHYVKLTYLKHA